MGDIFMTTKGHLTIMQKLTASVILTVIFVIGYLNIPFFSKLIPGLNSQEIVYFIYILKKSTLVTLVLIILLIFINKIPISTKK